jgi:RNA-directed DNA polymerase
MNTVPPPLYDWNTVPWKQAERAVFKLQKRIYQASTRGDTKTVHQLQRLLMTSWWACLIAVRRVTQDNQGKKTAGVDGVKNLNPKRRMELARTLQQHPFSPKTRPVRRVWIPKPGSEEQRPLGIPVMETRARQALVKLGLEPEWEAQFEPNSYGFRPGRSCHDAIEAIFTAIRLKAKYVLDADIAQCFNQINHSALLAKLHTFPSLRRVINAWLKAGILDNNQLFPSTKGVPQGGVLSPLLMNVALHGLETAVTQRFTRRLSKKSDPNRRTVRPTLIRYADDLVVIDENETTIHEIKPFIEAWLHDMGLELKPSKTRITHTLHSYEGNVGFDFLGFTIRQYPAGKARTAYTCRGKPLGYTTIIKPSKKAIATHMDKIRTVIEAHQHATQAVLIKRLNPIIRGWANYYATVCSKATFHDLDRLIYLKLRAWAAYRHPGKGKRWIATKYWHPERGSWRFASGTAILQQHQKTAIRRHTKVAGQRSPYDGDWIYWASRMGRHPEVPRRIAILLQRQKGKCAFCGLFFTDDARIEQDHIIPRYQDGKDEIANLQLLHRHCHDRKTAMDILRRWGGADDNSPEAEEPGEGATFTLGSEDEPFW